MAEGRLDTSRMTLPEAGQHLSLALEAVVAKFGAMVRQVARRYRLEESDVDEVMQEVRIRLWKARERRPAVRMYLAGYPREEIAELMGWTEGKTRNLLYRGLADLRARLTELGIGWQQAEEAS